MAPRTNREILTGGSKYKQKQSKKYGVDEVVFDRDSRKEYLTGFHKRKLERKKKAQEFYKEQERLAKIEDRKAQRDAKEQEFQDQIKQLQEAKSIGLTKEDLQEDEDNNEEEWAGFNNQEDSESDSESDDEFKPKGILARKQVYKIDDPNTLGDAVVDEETTVVVETLENPYTAAVQNRSLEAVAKANNVQLDKSEEVLEKSILRAKKYAVVCGVSKPKATPQKKKKFRYLTKTERQANNAKARLSKMKSRKRD